ncbi:MAG: flagellar P-ring protein [Melioribacteraceae bacterium]|nr:MAG: flagellar P-ring protein [Melioribacteraceae bacterium]
MKKILYIILILFTFSSIHAQRIKDIAFLEGEASEQIIGYGLVVGLSGTGDSYRSSFTIQSITSMLKRFGITVPQDDLKTKNVAAVMVTATINNYLKPGSAFDVNVSSLGDARSLTGGTLLMTPLSGLSGTVFGFAQGPLSIGGYDIDTPTGNRISKNHSLAGRVPRGGILKQALPNAGFGANMIKVFLKEPDLTTASNVATSINTNFGVTIAKASDASEIVVEIPQSMADNKVSFLSQLESITVEVDQDARVVLNERTGTVVSGQHVRIMPVTISHGSLNITIRSNPMISQPGMFSGGSTQMFNNLIPFANQDSSKTIAIAGASNIQEVAAALNSLKVSPRDIISIFQALKEAGALVAEIVII